MDREEMGRLRCSNADCVVSNTKKEKRATVEQMRNVLKWRTRD